MMVGDERDTASLPANKHSGIWVDRNKRATLKFLKRKHRPRGSFQQRLHSCFGDRAKVFCCLTCRLEVALKGFRYGDILFEEKPAELMRMIKSESHVLSMEANNLTWKSFRVGHAIHLATTGSDLGQIMAAGEWRSAAFAAYDDPNSLDTAVFLNQTMERSHNEDDPKK